MAFAGLKKQINKANQVSERIEHSLKMHFLRLIPKLGQGRAEKRDGNSSSKTKWSEGQTETGSTYSFHFDAFYEMPEPRRVKNSIKMTCVVFTSSFFSTWIDVDKSI